MLLVNVRLRLILLFLILGLECARAQEPSPSGYGFRSTPGENFLPRTSYRLTFLRAEPDKNHGVMGLFQLRHSGAQPIKLWGFRFEKDGSLRVRFERFSKLRDHKWQEVPVGYCGTGAETYAVEPERDYVLRVPLWPYLKEGTRGVVLLSGGTSAIVSEEFDGTDVRAVAVSRIRVK